MSRSEGRSFNKKFKKRESDAQRRTSQAEISKTAKETGTDVFRDPRLQLPKHRLMTQASQEQWCYEKWGCKDTLRSDQSLPRTIWRNITHMHTKNMFFGQMRTRYTSLAIEMIMAGWYLTLLIDIYIFKCDLTQDSIVDFVINFFPWAEPLSPLSVWSFWPC